MKVLTHEEAALGEEWRREIHAIKKNYYRLCFDVVERLKTERRLARLNARLAVLSLFGMMNWIYTWYNPRVDPDAETMAREMTGIFLGGILATGRRRPTSNGTARGAHRNGDSARHGTRQAAKSEGGKLWQRL